MRRYLEGTYESKDRLALDVNGENVSLSTAGVASGREVSSLYNWGIDSFATGTFTVGTGRSTSRIEDLVTSGRNKNATLFVGQYTSPATNRMLLKTKGEGSISALSREFLNNRYVRAYEPEARDYGGTVLYTGKGQLVGGGLKGFTRPGHDLGVYSHTKITLARRGNKEVAMLSTANTSDSSYDKQVNLYKVFTGKEQVGELKQVMAWLTEGKAQPKQAKGTAAPKGTELKSFWVSAPGAGNNAEKLAADIGKLKGQELWVISANLSDPKVIAALKAHAAAGGKVHVGVNKENDHSDWDNDWRGPLVKALGYGRNKEAKQQGAAQELGLSSKNVEIVQFDNNLKDGYRHLNALASSKGYAYLASMRLNESLMNHEKGGVVDIAYHGQDPELAKVIQSQFKARDAHRRTDIKQVYRRGNMFNVGGRGRPLGLENFMPSRANGGSVQYKIDVSAVHGATDYAINQQLYLDNEAAKGSGVAGAMAGLHRQQTEAYFRSEGMLTALHTMLVSERTPDGVVPAGTPDAIRYFDEAMKAPSFGQSDWWGSMWMPTEMGGGTQLGNRGVIDSIVMRGVRRMTRDMGKESGEAMSSSIEGLWNFGSSLFQNTAMFHFMGLPLLRATAHFRNEIREGFERRAGAGGIVSKHTIKLWDQFTRSSINFALGAIDHVVQPLAPFFGTQAEQLATRVREVYATSGSMSKANVGVFQAADKALGESVLRPLSTNGIGRVFQTLISPMNVYNSARALMGVPGAVIRDFQEAGDVHRFRRALAAAADDAAKLKAFQAQAMWSVASSNRLDIQAAFENNLMPETQARIDRLQDDIDASMRNYGAPLSQEDYNARRQEIAALRKSGKADVAQRQRSAVRNLENRVAGVHTMERLSAFSNIWENATGQFLGHEIHSLAGASKMAHVAGRVGYLGVGAVAVGNWVSAQIGDAPRATVWDQLMAVRAMESENERLGGSNYNMVLNYQAGFGRYGDYAYDAAKANPWTASAFGAFFGAIGGALTTGAIGIATRGGMLKGAGLGAAAGSLNSAVVLGAAGHAFETASHFVQLPAAAALNFGQWWKYRDRGGPEIKNMGQAGFANTMNLRMAQASLHENAGNADMAAYLYETAAGGLGPNRKTINGREIKAHALQWAPGGGLVGAITGSMNELGDKTTYALTLQGPVMVQVGFSLVMPIGQFLVKDPAAEGGKRWEWGYMPNTSFEALAATAFTFEGIRTAWSLTSAGARWAGSKIGGPDLAGSGQFMKTPLHVMDKIRQFTNRLASVPAYIASSLFMHARDNVTTRFGLWAAGVRGYGAELDEALANNLADDRADALEKKLREIKVSSHDVVMNLKAKVNAGTATAAEKASYDRALKTHGAITDELVDRFTGNRGLRSNFWTNVVSARWQPWTSKAVGQAEELRRGVASSTSLENFDKSFFNRVFRGTGSKGLGLFAAGAVFVVPFLASLAGESRTLAAAENLSIWAHSAGSSGGLKTLAQVALGFYGLGYGSRPFENSLEAEADSAYPGQMGGNAARKNDNSAWGMTVGVFTGRLQRAWKVGYLGGDSAFFGTGGVGVTVDPITGDTHKFSRAYAQFPFLLGLQLSVSGGIAGAKDNEQLSTWYNMSNFQSGTMNPLMVLRDKIREHKKGAVVGQMFHEASALSDLGSSGRREMSRRRNLTAWTLANNNGVDSMLYFFGDRRFNGINLKHNLPTGVSDFLFYKKSAGALEYGNSFLGSFDWSRNNSEEGYEIDGGWGDVNRTWAASKSLSAIDLLDNERSAFVRNMGLAVSGVAMLAMPALGYAFAASRWHVSGVSAIQNLSPQDATSRVRRAAGAIGNQIGMDLASFFGGGADESYHMQSWEVRPAGAVQGGYTIRSAGAGRSALSLVSIGQKFYTFGEGLHVEGLNKFEQADPMIRVHADKEFMRAATELSWTGDLHYNQAIVGDAKTAAAEGQSFTGHNKNTLQGSLQSRIANVGAIERNVSRMSLATLRAQTAVTDRITDLEGKTGDALTQDVKRQLDNLEARRAVLDTRQSTLAALKRELTHETGELAQSRKALDLISKEIQEFHEANSSMNPWEARQALNAQYAAGSEGMDEFIKKLDDAGVTFKNAAGGTVVNPAKLSIVGLASDIAKHQTTLMKRTLSGHATVTLADGTTTTMIKGLGWVEHSFLGGTWKLMGGAYAVGTSGLSGLTAAFISAFADGAFATEYRNFQEGQVKSVLNDVVGKISVEPEVHTSLSRAIHEMAGLVDVDGANDADDIVKRAMQYLRDEANHGSSSLNTEQIDKFHGMIDDSLKAQITRELKGSSGFMGRAMVHSVGRVGIAAIKQGAIPALVTPLVAGSAARDFSGVYGLGIVGASNVFTEDYRRGAAAIFTQSVSAQNSQVIMSVAGFAGGLAVPAATGGFAPGSLRGMGAKLGLGAAFGALAVGGFMKATNASDKAATVGAVSGAAFGGTAMSIIMGTMAVGAAAVTSGGWGTLALGVAGGMGAMVLANMAFEASGLNKQYGDYAATSSKDYYDWLNQDNSQGSIARFAMSSIAKAFELTNVPGNKLSEYARKIDSKPAYERTGWESFSGTLASWVGKATETIDPNKPVANLYNPGGTVGDSNSANLANWRMPHMNEQDVPQNAGFAARMTPFWYGNYKDAVFSQINDQEQRRQGNAREFVGEWFGDESIGGRRQDYAGSHITDATSHVGSFMGSSFGNLSTLSVESSQLQMNIRASASQTYMSSLLNRSAVWGNLAGKATVSDSGYGAGMGKYTEAYTRSGRIFTGYIGIRPTEGAGSGAGYLGVNGYGSEHVVNGGVVAPGNFWGKFRVSSEFGMRVHPITGKLKKHAGMDVAAPMGTPIPAPMAGVVVAAGWVSGYGRRMVLQHSDGSRTAYNHLSSFAAGVGAHIDPGEVIGRVGSSGASTGAHLHFEVTDSKGNIVNPRATYNQIVAGIARPAAIRAATGNGGTAVYVDLINSAARATGVPAMIIRGVMQQESGGNPNARSPVGALGLMQFMPGTARGLGIDPLDPQQAILGGAKHLRGLYGKFHNWKDALAAYNAGADDTEAHGKKRIGPFARSHDNPVYRVWENPTNSGYAQTRNYVASISHGIAEQGVDVNSLGLAAPGEGAMLPIELPKKPKHKAAAGTGMKRKTAAKTVTKATITISPSKDHEHQTSKYRKNKPKRKDIVVGVDPETQSMIASATYPDGEAWTSMYSKYQEPVEMLGVSRYAKAG